MPNVVPTAKDVVQIKIRGTAGFDNEHFITAEIDGPKPNADTNFWSVRVFGDPELTGTIDIDKYQWDHKQTRWMPKEAPVHAAPIPKYDTNAQPTGAEFDELSIPRTAGKRR